MHGNLIRDRVVVRLNEHYYFNQSCKDIVQRLLDGGSVTNMMTPDQWVANGHYDLASEH